MDFDYDTDFTEAHPKDASGNKLITYPHEVGPVTIAVQDGVVSSVIQKKIKNGRYESHEAKTIARIVGSDEILLEIGAGVGVISSVAWLTQKVREVHCYEADPRLIPLLKSTHEQNKVRGFVHNSILTDDEEMLRTGAVDFYIREHFYGNSTNRGVGREVAETVRVPTERFAAALDKIRPTIIACDVEGGELGLFDGASLSSVRKVMVETHQNSIGGGGMRRVFHAMHKGDFHYDERYSSGSVCVFSRIDD